VCSCGGVASGAAVPASAPTAVRWYEYYKRVWPPSGSAAAAARGGARGARGGGGGGARRARAARGEPASLRR
jgi:hypothetical protein